jgi:hypothetical protein
MHDSLKTYHIGLALGFAAGAVLTFIVLILFPPVPHTSPNIAPPSATCSSFWIDGTCYESRSRATMLVQQYTTGTINLYPDSLYRIEIYSKPVSVYGPYTPYCATGYTGDEPCPWK